MTALLSALLLAVAPAASAKPPAGEAPAKAAAATKSAQPARDAAKDARPKILVLGVEAPALGAEKVRELNAVLVSSVEKLNRFNVFRSTAAALPDPGRKPSKPGEPCEVTAPCLEDAAAADVEQTVSASAGPLGSGWTLRLRLVDEKNMRVQARTSIEVSGPDGLAEAIRQGVPRLFDSVK